MLSPKVVAAALPTWVDAEIEYAFLKYGPINPQLSALHGGLREGGSSYMDYMNYLSKFMNFYAIAEFKQGALKSAQALGKFVNVSVALSCVFAEQRLFKRRMIDAYDSEVKGWLEEALPGVLPSEPITALEYKPQLDAQLFEIADCVDAGHIDAAEAGARALLLDQAAFAIGHISALGYMAEPGVSSGFVREWQIPTL